MGLALELGVGSALALAASLIPALAWSPPIAPLGLLLVSAFAFAMAASLCTVPTGGGLAPTAGRASRQCHDLRSPGGD